ncbi:MAG: hypothetical protein ABI637_03795 [Gemmatimonadota bacterium]
MTPHEPFEARPDAVLGRLIREHLESGDDGAFVARVRAAVSAAERDTSWDVLARWVRPGLAAASLVIGLGLWLALGGNTDRVTLAEAISPASAPTQLFGGAQTGSEVVIAALMGGE